MSQENDNDSTILLARINSTLSAMSTKDAEEKSVFVVSHLAYAATEKLLESVTCAQELHSSI